MEMRSCNGQRVFYRDRNVKNAWITDRFMKEWPEKAATHASKSVGEPLISYYCRQGKFSLVCILTDVSGPIKPSAQQREFLDRILDSSSMSSFPEK